MFHKKALSLSLLCLLLGNLTMPASAGIFGKIAGLVTDQKTGEPLPGANVVIVGSHLGATSDPQGNYFILNVTPGIYSVQFSYLGYTTVVVKDVKVVQDLTSEINVQLVETALELGETIEVVADRPLVRKEVSATAMVVSSEEFKNRPIESVQSVVNTSVGVTAYQGRTYIRGSRWTDVSYMVDGIPLTNPITGGLITDISKDAVEEIVLLTGGFSAEYGNAMGGVVNVSTKDGGPNLAGSLRYKTDQLSSGSQYFQNANIWDFTLGGPLFKNIRFFTTAYLNLRDMNVQRKVIAPDGVNLGRHPHEGFQEYRTNLKLSIPIRENLKLRLTASLNRTQQLLYNLYWRFGDNPDQLDHHGAVWQKSKHGAAVINHVVSPRAFYTLRFGYLNWHSINGQRDRSEWSGLAEGSNADWWGDFKFRKPFLDHNYRIPGDPTIYSKWRLRDSQGVSDVFSQRTSERVVEDNPYGVPGGILNTVDANYFQNFVWSGDRDFYEENGSRQLSASFDFTSQLTPKHEVKIGFGIVSHRVNRFRISGMAAPNGVGVTFPVIDFYEKSPSDTSLTVQDVDDLGSGYTPLELSAYSSYQLKLKGMFVNLGLRYDYYKAETEHRLNPLEPEESNPFKQTRVKSKANAQLSPRLGISFPVTDRMLFRFNYGHFFQRPPMDRMFSFLWLDLNQADANMGNPDIDAQKTIAYEIGLSYAIREDLAIDVTAYQKNMFNLEGFRIFRAPDLEWYFLAVNQEYGESRGIELSLRKRYSHWFSSSVTYTLSVARGTASDVSQISRYPLTGVTFAKELGFDPIYPQDTLPMNFDRRHSVNLIFDFNVPQGQGPKAFGLTPLSGFGVNLTGFFNSGTPYTEVTEFFVNLTTDRFNSANYPSTYGVDARLHKDFYVAGRVVSVFAEIFNLLNLDKPFSVFEGSGNADQPDYSVTKGAISSDSYPSDHPLYSGRADANNDGILDSDERLAAYQRFESDMLAFKQNFSLPRRALFGVEMQF